MLIFVMIFGVESKLTAIQNSGAVVFVTSAHRNYNRDARSKWVRVVETTNSEICIGRGAQRVESTRGVGHEIFD